MKTKKKQNEYDIYDDKKDAFLSGYSEGLEDTINTLVYFNAFNDDFLLDRILNFIVKYKKCKKMYR